MSKLSPWATFQKCNYCKETSFLCHPESRPLWMFLMGRIRPFHTRYYKYSALWAYCIIWFDVVLKKTTVYPSVSQRQLRPHVWVAHSCPWVADGRGNSPGKKPPRPPPYIKNKAHNAQQDMWDPPSHPYLPCPLPRIYFLTSKYMPAP